ncbi:disulfide bond formation protein B [Pelagibius sp. Alg239-R121]|uniref:disulfide bond formation protein B n=1 Tax=Pelagibius sp. Alg239-R121 TaxID=2993448 RepID=UPI0024A7036B|nr:disulfide bond formation protein B [Pelagibius sp. Alg239-R121]
MSVLAEQDPLFKNPRLIPAAIVLVCLAALGSAFASEIWGGLDPCVLCIYQRYAYGAAMIFGIGAFVVADRPKLRRMEILLAALAFLAGAGIAMFHVGVEQQWWQGTESCYAPAVDFNASIDDLRQQLLAKKPATCDQVAWSLGGISIAGYNVIASLIFAAGCLWAGRRAGT